MTDCVSLAEPMTLMPDMSAQAYLSVALAHARSFAMAEPWRGLLHQLTMELECQSAKLRDLELQNRRLLEPGLTVLDCF